MRHLKELFGIVATAGMIVVAGPAPVHAQGTADERSACMGDAFNFCSAVIPDVEKITACLKENVSRLTPACQAEFQPSGYTKIKARHFEK